MVNIAGMEITVNQDFIVNFSSLVTNIIALGPLQSISRLGQFSLHTQLTFLPFLFWSNFVFFKLFAELLKFLLSHNPLNTGISAAAK
jgi:hypothetical protein